MSIARRLAAMMGVTDTLYVEDVFSAYTYTGNGATQTITNGVNLSGLGGAVLIKCRNVAATDWQLHDTDRGVSKYYSTNLTDKSNDSTSYGVTAFNSNGFDVADTAAGGWGVNGSASARTYVSWSFAKANKFFTQVPVTVSGSNVTVDLASLGTVGMIVLKGVGATSDWWVWHRSLTSGYNLRLNTTAAESNSLVAITVSGTTATVVQAVTGNSTFELYAWAHDTASTGIIQCGTFTTDGSGNATVTTGWEPQLAIPKKVSATGQWLIMDSARGFGNNAVANTLYLVPNASDADAGPSAVYGVSATGLVYTGLSPSATYIYLAIRRGPMKLPTVGTQVYSGINANGATGTRFNAGFPIDLQLFKYRQGTSASDGTYWFDRLRGLSTTDTASSQGLLSHSTGAEAAVTSIYVRDFDSVGFEIGSSYSNTDSMTWNFRRYPGVFDEVCWTGTNSTTARISHNLTVVPELAIEKQRNGTGQWYVYHASLGITKYLQLQATSAAGTYNVFGASAPTATDIGVDEQATSIGTGTAVMYLFATLAGISKVFSYTGNGSNQTINCGFAAGARFILIKRTDSTGDWFLWDSVRGIVAGNDPHLSLNTTAAEVTTDDSVDTDNSGFIVNQDAATNINVNAATYIGFAIS